MLADDPTVSFRTTTKTSTITTMSVENGWKRLQRGMPAILLGTLFNVLDAVSTGLLVFPSDGNAFANLQNKSMSTYIMR